MGSCKTAVPLPVTHIVAFGTLADWGRKLHEIEHHPLTPAVIFVQSLDECVRMGSS